MTLAAPQSVPPVSVIIPSYNYAHYLRQAVDSVLSQTHSALEVIVVDDGSTDCTQEICAQVTDPRFRWIRQDNAGLSAARNTGIRESRYSLVAFLDADDRWDPTFLATVVSEMDRLGPAFVAVSTATMRMDADGNPLPPPRRNFLRSGELTVSTFCLRNRPLSSSVVMRSQVFKEFGGFDTGLRSSEDRDMWIRLTARGQRFYYLDAPLAIIRRHPQNMSKNAPRMKQNSGMVLRRAWDAGVVPRRHLSFWLRVAGIHYFVVAWTHFDDGMWVRAWRYLLTSIVLWPFFLRPQRVAEPPLFRLRAMIHFAARLGHPLFQARLPRSQAPRLPAPAPCAAKPGNQPILK